MEGLEYFFVALGNGAGSTTDGCFVHHVVVDARLNGGDLFLRRGGLVNDDDGGDGDFWCVEDGVFK